MIMPIQTKTVTDKPIAGQGPLKSSTRIIAGSGAAMDEKIRNPGKKWKYISLIIVGIIIVGAVIWSAMSLSGDRSFRVPADTLTIAEVTTGIFEDYTPIRGRTVPRTTVYLDAIEGGRVDKVITKIGFAILQFERIK